MRGFHRSELRFSLCGLACCLCPIYHMAGGCPGCGGGAGNQSCAIARCSLSHGDVAYCWQCEEYPCGAYDGFFDYDSFLPKRNAPQDIRRCREMGIDAFCQELERKREILEELLAGYNDGRKKTFYCTAVNLLPWEGLQAAMAELRSTAATFGTLSERAAAAERVFRERAAQQGISLSLRRKPKKPRGSGG